MSARKTKTSAAVKNRYNEKAYDRISVVVPKGSKQRIKDYAESHGFSVNGLICEALYELTGLDLSKQEETPEP